MGGTGRITVSKSRDFFLREGEKFFYLADTCWSAFTNATYEEWDYYLEYRRMQGFNALQINILPQHDRSLMENSPEPFEALPDGGWDFSRRSEKYFDRAEKMVEAAVDKGFVPALVLLWCNYVRGTWGSKINPSRIIPIEKLEEYVSYIVERFGKYNPIFIISGDTDFETDESIEYYKNALNIVKNRSPDSLTTMHIMGGFWNLPETFIKSPEYDFYMYQSGHLKEHQHLSYELAQRFYNMPVKRPIVNGEPCYEGHSHGNKYGRFNSFDVRKAIWQSLLSGAKAGTAYGSHGVWPWHRRGCKFGGEPFSGAPYEWSVALKFPGAFDAAFAKQLFEKNDLFDIEPANSKLLNETAEIRVSESKEKIVVYTPYNWDVKLKIDGASYEWEGIVLGSTKFFKPNVKTFEDYSVIEMSEFNNDILIIGTRS
ncbi:MAG: DUF4038 domain-containing protein [Crenarchaeota archaeon]|nr:DUF4038 domain-containing protein [Thermoproteota archaeon]